MKSNWLVCILLLFPTLSFSQSNSTVDSLQNVLKTESNDSLVVQARLNLFEEFYLHDKTISEIHLSEAESLARSVKSPGLLGDVFNKKAHFFLNENRFRESLEAFLLAKAFYEKANLELDVLRMLNMIGAVHLQRGNYLVAILKFKKVIGQIDESKAGDVLEEVYNNLGVAYYYLENFDLAEYYYLKGLNQQRRSKQKDELKIAFYYNNLAEVYARQEHYLKARNLLMKSIEKQRSLGHINTLGLEYNNLGKVYLKLNQFDSSQIYLEKALFTGQDFNNEYDLANTHLIKSQLDLKLSDFEGAEKEANQCLELAQRIDVVPLEIQALQTLADINQMNGLHDIALDQLKQANFLKDSMNRIGNEFELLQAENGFDSEERLKEFQVNQLEWQVDQSHFWEKDWFIIAMFFLLGVGLLVTIQIVDKREEDQGQIDFGSVNYLRSNRILWIIAGVFYTLIPLVVPHLPGQIYDPMAVRVCFTGAVILLFISTFLSYRARTNAVLISKILYLFMIAHHFYLIYQNQLALVTIFYLIILLSGISTVFRDTLKISLVSVLIVIMSALVGYAADAPQVSPGVFLAVIISLMVVFIVVTTAKSDLGKHLEYATEVVSQSDVLAFIVNQKGEVVFTSQTIRHILGYAPSEISGHDWIERLGVEAQEAKRIKNNLIRIAKGIIEPGYNEYQLLKDNKGHTKWISFNEKRIGQNRVLVIGVDVTAHKLIQDELAKSERNFRQISETLSDVFYLYHVAKEEYEYVSPNTEEVLGVSTRYFYKNLNFINEYVHEADREVVHRSWRKVNKGIPIDIEYRIYFENKIKWIRERSYPVRDEDGLVVKKSGLCQDITEQKFAEEEIEKLSLIASYTDNFILMINQDNRIEWVNASFTRLTGYTEQDVLNKMPGEILIGPSTIESKVEKITTAVFDQKQQLQCELLAYKKDQEAFYSQLEITPIINQYGELEKYFMIGKDITKQKEDREAIEKLSLVASKTNNYVIIANAKDGIEWVNEAFCNKFEYTLDEVKGLFPSKFLVDTKTHPNVSDYIDQVVFVEKRQFEGEIVHITKSGKQVFVYVEITPIWNEANEVEKYFVLGVDITYQKRYEEQIEQTNAELKEKEQALHFSESNFRQLIRSIKEVFWLRDIETDRLLFISDSYQKVFGKPKSTLLKDNSSWSDHIHPEDKDRVRKAYETQAFEGEFNQDYRILMKDGSIKWLNSRVFPIENEQGKVVRLSGFTEDITVKKEQEIRIQKIADRLDVVHTIEKTILESESTTEIIYNTLSKTLEKLPILRASLALFDEENQSFYSYARMKNGTPTATDQRKFRLREFGEYSRLKSERKHIIQNLLTKEQKTETDHILIEEGAVLVMISPLLHGDNLIGSLNVCFTDDFQEDTAHYKEITNEVANGLAIAIQQSQLKDELSQTNDTLTASIDYAKMIQQAYIPNNINIFGTIENSMIINRPKDIVSGDFYWVTSVGDKKVVVVGDCTGHGVPGAFMTIIGISSLNNIVTYQGVTDPASILNRLNDAVIKALHSDQNIQLKDGMDVGVFVYDSAKQSASFGGARRPLTILRKDGTIENIKPTRLSIGVRGDEFGITFNTLPVELRHGDRYYMYSDGITDQFGGAKHRKFGKKRLEQAIIDSKDISLEEQKKYIIQSLESWKGSFFQVDDILLAGFELD